MDDSRLPGFHRMTVDERRALLAARGHLAPQDCALLADGGMLEEAQADCMVENVIGRFSLPLGIASNFIVNGRERLVPMVVEEPSIVAGVSAAAKLARASGGFESILEESLLIGQVQIVDAPNPDAALRRMRLAAPQLLRAAAEREPRLHRRGGGLRRVECFEIDGMLIAHLAVDTRDAMGANLVNGLCEALAPLLEELSGGTALLRILSNLADDSIARAEVVIPAELLAAEGLSGEAVRDRIVCASRFAQASVHRAVTHNKGIMNGIDAVALATGNDWRAIEAGAHAYAARSGRYGPLAVWEAHADGSLRGSIELPLKVGAVGAQVEAHPGVQTARRILAIESARELAEIMAAVGLAQNLAALRALTTTGISRGHLRLHARAAVLAAGVPPEHFERVLARLLEERQIKVWRAKELLEEIAHESRARAA